MAEMTGIVKSNNEDLALSFIRDNFSLNISRDEFNKIDARLFCMILAKFLEDFGVDNYSQLDLLAFKGVSDIENYEETTQVINLWRAVFQLLSPMGLNDFSLGDLLQPRKAKALKVIIFLIRLWEKFVCVHADWMKIEEQFAEIPERKRAIENENRELQSHLEERSCLLAKLRSDNGAQEQKLASAVEEQSKLMAIGNALSEESRALKLHIVTKKEELSDITLKTSQIKQQIEEVQAQIVHSPDKIIAEIENKEKQLEDLRSDKLLLDKEYTLISQSLQNLEIAQKQTTATMDILSQTAADVESLKDEIRKIESIKSSLVVKQQTLVELNAVCQKNEMSIEQIQKQKSIASIQRTQRLKPTKELNDNCKDKLNQLSETESKLVTEHKQEQQRISEEFAKKAKEHEDFFLQLKSSREAMYSKVGEYSQQISKIKVGISRKHS